MITESSYGQDVATAINTRPIKISVCSYNIGHFSVGRDYDTYVSDQKGDYDYTNYQANNSTPYSNYEKQKERWHQVLNEYSPDVLMMCEYITVFAHNANGDVNADTEIFSQYPYKRIGSLPEPTSYMRTAVYSRFPLGVATETVYAQTVQAGRYYQQMDIVLGGKPVTLVITHLDFNQGANGQTYRGLQIQTLVSAFRSKEHVVICGDFNTWGETEFEPFKNAGFDMANRGYLGGVPTYPSSGTEYASSHEIKEHPEGCLDNIITRGFYLSNIRIIDRCGLMADLTLIDEA